MEPRATRVSILGALFFRAVKPLMKNFWLMTMMIPASRSCTRPMATWFPWNQAGRGQPNIMWPMEKYMSTARKPRE